MTHYHACDRDSCSDIVDIWVRTDIRWRNTRTGEVQNFLRPGLNIKEWIQEKRKEFRRYGEWEVIEDGD